MKQEIHFVTGKGGVGKSVIAAALALNKSRAGQRVLLVELGDQSFFKDFFDLPMVGYEPVLVAPNLSLALWTGETCLQEYAKYLIKVEKLAKLFFENSVMKAFIGVAPALPELAILGKITSGPRKYGPPVPFDCIIVDAFATGHFTALLKAPKGMAEAIQFGPMGEQSRSIDSCIRDEDLCHYHIVTLPEELPVKEAVELHQILKDEFSVSCRIIMNKIMQTSVPRNSLKEVEAEDSDLGKFAAYIDYQLEHQQQMLNKIKGELKVKTVPQFFETQSWPLIEKIAEALK
ncbi:MAG: ArsA family ATPase [Pseudobdellovibrionaceae bacterium]